MMLVKDYIDKINLVINSLNKDDDKYKIIAYRNVIKKLKDFANKKSKKKKEQSQQKLTNSDINFLNLTDHMKNKLKAWRDEGYLGELIQKPSSSLALPNPIEKSQIKAKLMNISGIGSKKAEFLIDNGVTSVDQLTPESEWWKHLSIETQKVIENPPAVITYAIATHLIDRLGKIFEG